MPPKRKRPERSSVDSGGGRPSPHRPGDTNLGQHDRNYQDSGPRYGGRGGNRNGRRNDRRDSSQNNHNASNSFSASSNPVSPTVQRPPSASSQTAPPPINTAPTVMAPPSPPRSPIVSGYCYDVITDSRLSNWSAGGRQEVVDHGSQSRDDEDFTELSTIFQELLQSTLDYRLKAAEAGSVVKDIVGPRPEDADTNLAAFDAHTQFLDTVSIFLDIESGTYRPQLRDFMVATEISPMLMRKILEPAFLEQLGLIRDTFTKIGIRQTTNILYRQANYNLLREETEGYSKLATELFTTSNSEPPTAETVQATFERVKGLIGTFDLDVGRALDVTLDVFGSVLIKQFRFFVKFLRISSWWPRTQVRAGSIGTTFVGGLPKWGLPESSHWLTSEEDETVIVEQRRLRDVQFWERAREVHLDAYFELGGRQVANNELKRLQDMVQAASNGELNKDVDPEIQWIVNTRTLPPSGNRIAAQLLGFKLRFYDSDAKDDSDVLPANIFYMAALLIKIGFISLCDLYPHVSPADDGMEAVREARMKLLAEEERAKTGKTNALAMLGVLPEDEKDVQRTNKLNAEMRAAAAAAAAAKVKPVEVIYQKVQLLEELLTVGAIPEALFILGRFPWLPEAFPKLLNYIHRLLHSSLEKVYCECRPATRASIDTNLKKLPESDQSAVPKGSIKITPVPSKRPLRWPHPDGEKDGAPYRCYWDEWADNVPVCQTVDDVFTLCGTLMNLSGVNIGKDEALLSKLAVIGTKSLATDQSQQNRDRWQDLLKRLIVPALSLTSSNSATVNAVWNMLNLYPTTVRYNMYAEWYKGATSRQPAMRAAFARTKSETLSVLKRVSTQNISTMSRKLAKAAFASPGVVFDTAIEQLESYPNLIPAFVECARYFTDMGYDILVWSLMSALGGNRSRTQAGSILYTSEWLKSLSKLSGQVFKRYNNMRPTPVLQYVNDQLFKGNSTDLVLLRELISSMAGVVPDADFTDAQLKSMTGGEVLRRQTLIHLGDRRFESTRGAKRLMQALIDTKLAGGLLINLAQYRQSGVFKVPESQAHIKYLSSLLDDAHQAFMQYLDLLRSNLSADQFDSLIPGIIALVQDFGLDVSFAFMIGRASLAYRMSNPKSPALGSVKDDQSQLTLPATDAEGDLSMTEEDVSVQPVAPVNDKMVLDDTPVNGSAAPVAQTPRKSDPLLDSLQPIIEGIQPILSPEIWARLSPEFFVMFWSLQLSDLSVPQTNYMAEHDRLNKAAEDVMKDRSDMTRNGMNKKDKEKRALLDVASSIREEMKAHVERYQKTRFRLAKQSKSWFPGAIADVNAISDTLIEQCLLPRMLLSATDTEYCFRVIKFLHENRAPNFKLSSLYERFFNANRLRSMIFSCSVREAEYLGRFIKLILEDLSRWQGDQNLYEKEALGQKGETRNYIGFATAFDDDGKPTAFIDHTSFRDSHYEWHKNLNSALKSCLQDTEWMHIRNALTVLKTITSYFPAVNFMGKNLMAQLEAIRLREQASTKASEASDDKRAHRVDLAVTAQTTASALIKRTTQWVMVQAFRTNASAKEKEASKDADAASSTLRPTAPEFKPQPAKSNVTQATEVEEDGEVQDGKDAKAAESSDSLAPKPNPSSRRSSVSGVEDKGKDLDAKDLTAAPAARPVTPKLPASTPAPRSDTARSTSRPITDRVPHGLPSRPDVPLPGNFRPDRYGQVQIIERRESGSRDTREQRDARDVRDPRDLRDPRDPRDSRDPRDFRQPEHGRLDRPRDIAAQERRPNNPSSRDTGRLAERDWAPRQEAPPRRGDLGPPDREPRLPRERGTPTGGRVHESRLPRESPLPAPPTAPSAPGPQDLPINPDRAARLQQEDRPDIINPARAQILERVERGPPARSPRDAGRERPLSRAQSPRRGDRFNSDGPPVNGARDDHHSRLHPSEHHGSARDSFGDGPPSQPRDRVSDRDGDRHMNDRSRDLAYPGPANPRSQESDSSRISQQDPNYGRLNPIQSVVPDIPSGPRGRGRNATRGHGTNGPSRPDNRFPTIDTNRAPSPERAPPTGPSSASRSRRPQFDNAPPNAPASATSSSPTTGVHPDRLRQIGGNTSQANSVPVHPDRMNHIAPPPPPPASQPPNPRQNMPPMYPNDRGSGNVPTTPGSDHHGLYSTPTGPASTNERSRTGGRRQLAGINNTLQQAGSSEVPTRGNSQRRGGGRERLAGSDAQILTGSSPVSTPVQERQDPMRRDVPDRLPHGNEQNIPPTRDSRGPNGDDYPGGRNEHERTGRREHRDRSDRSNRPSRRSSRERSPRGDRDVKEPREYRDRRSGIPNVGDANAGDRDNSGPRRPPRDSTGGNRDSLPGGPRDNIGGGNRESRHRGGEGRGDGGNGRLNEEWGGGGRGLGRGGGSRPGDDRRDDRGRKRRSEGDTGPADREKRQRQR